MIFDPWIEYHLDFTDPLHVLNYYGTGFLSSRKYFIKSWPNVYGDGLRILGRNISTDVTVYYLEKLQ